MVSTTQQHIDPSLMAPSTPTAVPGMTTPQKMGKQKGSVSILLTVEELRSMIFEAVHKAIHGEAPKTPATALETGSSDNGALKPRGEDEAVEHEQDVAVSPVP